MTSRISKNGIIVVSNGPEWLAKSQLNLYLGMVKRGIAYGLSIESQEAMLSSLSRFMLNRILTGGKIPYPDGTYRNKPTDDPVTFPAVAVRLHLTPPSPPAAS